jgi:hypothetical protein
VEPERFKREDLAHHVQHTLEHLSWPRIEAQLASNTEGLQIGTVHSLRRAVVESYKARLTSMKVELAALPTAVAVALEQTKNVSGFIDRRRALALINPGPSGDGENYLADLLGGGSLGRRVNSVTSYNTCVGLLFLPSFSNQPALPRGSALNPNRRRLQSDRPLRRIRAPPSADCCSPAPTVLPAPSTRAASTAILPGVAWTSGRWGGFAFANPTTAALGPSSARSPGLGSSPASQPGSATRQGQAVALTCPRRPDSAVQPSPPWLSRHWRSDQDYNCPFCQAPPPGGGILQHSAFECPAIYARHLGEPCPGFNSAGFFDSAGFKDCDSGALEFVHRQA